MLQKKVTECCKKLLHNVTKCGIYINVTECCKGGLKMGNYPEKLRKLRGDRTIQEIASAVGVSRSAMQMYELGERVPRDEVKVRIAEFYGETVQNIFFN